MRLVSWAGLKKLRGPVENTAMARRALGPEATPTAVASLANYFSRVINGHVRKVSLLVISEIAVGLGYKAMSSFYADWERTTADQPPRHRYRPAPGAAASPEPLLRPFTKSVDSLSPNVPKSGRNTGAKGGDAKQTADRKRLEENLKQLRAIAESCTDLIGDSSDFSLNPPVDRVRPKVARGHRRRSPARTRS